MLAPRPRPTAPMSSSFTLLHTADWHLGHTLHGHVRLAEHAAFLAWLGDVAVAREVDALLVAGDIFDVRSPPASAQALLYSFLAEVRARLPRLSIVLLSGNHDSASRLTAPRPLLEPLGVAVVGAAVPGAPPGDLVVPVRRAGELVAAVAAIPYLRPSDLASVGDGLDPARLSAATAALHAEVGRAARATAGRALPVIGAAHGELRGAILSPRSERPVAGGGPCAMSATALVPEAAYVALGHLHFPQALAGAPHARYSGSPFPLALDEASYRHTVSLVTFRGAALERVEELAVPRPVEILRIPVAGDAPLGDVLGALAALPLDDGRTPEGRWPFVEVCVRLEAAERGLRARIEEALAGRAARLARIVVQGATAPARAPRISLAELDVREMVVRKWEAEHGAPPAEDVLAALDEVVAAAAAHVAEDDERRAGARAGRSEGT